MLLQEARRYMGEVCSIRWQDQDGHEQVVESLVFDVAYVPMSGAFVATEREDIPLTRVRSIFPASQKAHGKPVTA